MTCLRAIIWLGICTARLIGSEVMKVPFPDLELLLSRIEALKAQVGDRKAEMLVEFSLAAPDLKDFTHNKLADTINSHEDFDDPNSLSLHVAWWSGLTLYYSAPGDSWMVRMPPGSSFGYLPGNQKTALERAIKNQIQKQRILFPARSQIQKASAKHLLGCSSDAKESIYRIENMVSMEAKKAEAMTVADRMIEHGSGGFFQELEAQGIDVGAALVDPWKPISLVKAISLYALLVQQASGEYVEGNSKEDSFMQFYSQETTATLQVLLVYAAFEHRKFKQH